MRCQHSDCRTPMVASATHPGVHSCPACGYSATLTDLSVDVGPTSLVKPGIGQHGQGRAKKPDPFDDPMFLGVTDSQIDAPRRNCL